MTAVDLANATSVSWTPGVNGATVVLTVTNPDLTTATPTVAEATGVYSATVTTAQAGRYRLVWTIAATSKVYNDVLDVWPADPRLIVPIDEMISALRITSTVTAADRSDMRLFIAAATPVIEDIAGAVLVRTVVQTENGGFNTYGAYNRFNGFNGMTGINLWEKAASITSVVADGVALVANSTYYFDQNAGIVYGAFPYGLQNIVITYTVGTSIVDPSIRLATIELVRHWWQWGRNTHRAAIPGDSPATPMGMTPSGYAVPNRVLELVFASRRQDGFA